MAASNSYTGPWEDTPKAAVNRAVADTKLPVEDYIECELSNGFQYRPIDPQGEWAVDVELVYSEARDQYRAKLRRFPNPDI